MWNVDTGQQLFVLRGPARPIRTIAVSPTGRFLVAGGDDPQLSNWDLGTRQRRTTAAALTGRVTAIAVVPDEKVIVAGDEAGQISLFDSASGNRVGMIPTAASPEAQPNTVPGSRP
jgi:WD40 repeat protein